MGLLDMFAGLGKGGGGLGGAMQNLSKGIGNKGGLLSQFGMGQYGDAPGAGGLSSLQDFLQRMAEPQGGPPEASQGGQPSPAQPTPPEQQSGLTGLIMRYLNQQRR